MGSEANQKTTDSYVMAYSHGVILNSVMCDINQRSLSETYNSWRNAASPLGLNMVCSKIKRDASVNAYVGSNL